MVVLIGIRFYCMNITVEVSVVVHSDGYLDEAEAKVLLCGLLSNDEQQSCRNPDLFSKIFNLIDVKRVSVRCQLC